MNQDIPIDELRRMFEYDSESGSLIYRSRASTRAPAGSKAGFLNHKGYRLVGIKGKQYRAHRIILAIASGQWPSPDLVIDHINGVKTDNRPANLRLADNSQNQSAAPSRRGDSGLRGASWDKRNGRWKSKIMKGKKPIHIGYFDTKEEAHEAYCRVAGSIHGEFSSTECKPCARDLRTKLGDA